MRDRRSQPVRRPPGGRPGAGSPPTISASRRRRSESCASSGPPSRSPAPERRWPCSAIRWNRSTACRPGASDSSRAPAPPAATVLLPAVLPAPRPATIRCRLSRRSRCRSTRACSFHVPSLTRRARVGVAERVSHIELATPGPMGLAGLLIAKVLRLPVTASYHIEVLGLVRRWAGTPSWRGGIRRYLAWFYAQVDRVFVMSSRSRDTLIQLGIEPDKLSVTPMAVDPDDFSPAHRSPQVFEVLDLSVGDRPVVLSVGRMSKEKNLPIVVEAVERLQVADPAPAAGDRRRRTGAQAPRARLSGQDVRSLRRAAVRRHVEEAVRVGAACSCSPAASTRWASSTWRRCERHAGAGADGRLHRRVRHPRRLGGMLRVRRGRAGRRHRARPRRPLRAQRLAAERPARP